MRAPDTVREATSENLDPRIATILGSISLVDKLIAKIDQHVASCVDAILHHPAFQALEAAWRGLKFVVDSVEPGRSVKIDVWWCSKSELQMDLEDNIDRTKSTFFQIVYSGEYGQHGGVPYRAVFACFPISSTPPDMALLRGVAAVAAMAHAPIFVDADPRLFGVSSFQELRGDLRAIFGAPRLQKWNEFRTAEDSKYVGVLLPKMQLRLPYRDAELHLPFGAAGDDDEPSFIYNERIQDVNDLLWGSATYAFATRLADSHVRFGTAMGLVGTSDALPPARDWHRAMNGDALKPPVDVVFSHDLEVSLAAHGFIPLTSDPIHCTFRFSSANSLQKPKIFGGEHGPQDTRNYFMATQMPYLLFACPFAHVIKLTQREIAGSHQSVESIARILTASLKPYQNSNPSRALALKYPLREAQVEVIELPWQPEWYAIRILLWPHMTYKGVDIGLALPGKLERNPRQRLSGAHAQGGRP
ncbi:type VI secretion system contractile sheath large subunit [Pendulispora brunnea]|uniref:Type VI secretion system contractile sheath large subunit n=1 Tax=Pendulispora brunnea TaxID=2905690 RepID=A0ABZ2KGZ4_9BACT